jgi:hypothetical protein
MSFPMPPYAAPLAFLFDRLVGSASARLFGNRRLTGLLGARGSRLGETDLGLITVGEHDAGGQEVPEKAQLLAPFLLLLSEPDPGATTVLVDELDAGNRPPP